MPTCYYPRFEVCRIAADGERIALPALTVNVYNVTAASSLGTLVSDADSIIDDGSFTADIFDVIEISHATYPLTCRFTLTETQDEAYELAENHIAIYIAENLYTDTTESKTARLYAIDLDNLDVAPQYLADVTPGVATEIPFQTSVEKNLRLVMISQDINKQQATFDIATAPETFDITIPVSTGGYQPLDATLTALAGANWAANALPIGSGADTLSQVSFAANTFPARASTGNLVAKTITDFGLSLVDDADAAAARTTLGLVIGTNVQAYDADLTTWAGITPGTGVGTALAVNIGTAGAFVVNGGALGTPSSGMLTNCTFPTLNQNTTGSAATLTTARAIYGNNFDGSAALTQIIASTYGGTGNGFTKFSGPTTAEKTFTLPNASATILTSNAAVTIAQGGTNATSFGTTNGVAYYNGTSIVNGSNFKFDGTTVTAASGLVVGAEVGGFVGSGSHRSQIIGTGTQSNIMMTGGAVGIEMWKDTTPTRAWFVGMSQPGGGVANDYIFSRYASGWAEMGRFTDGAVFKIGGTATRGTTEGSYHIDLFNCTAPVGTLTNGASLYVTGGEMRVMDSAGNATLISPHDEDGNWIHDEINFKGRRLRVDMERMVKALDKLLGGGFVQEFLIET